MSTLTQITGKELKQKKKRKIATETNFVGRKT